MDSIDHEIAVSGEDSSSLEDEQTLAAAASAGEADLQLVDGAQEQAASEEDVEAAALRGDVDELVDLAAQRDEYLALAQRTQADFENYRKRIARESTAAQQRG